MTSESEIKGRGKGKGKDKKLKKKKSKEEASIGDLDKDDEQLNSKSGKFQKPQKIYSEQEIIVMNILKDFEYEAWDICSERLFYSSAPALIAEELRNAWLRIFDRQSLPLSPLSKRGLNFESLNQTDIPLPSNFDAWSKGTLELLPDEKRESILDPFIRDDRMLPTGYYEEEDYENLLHHSKQIDLVDRKSCEPFTTDKVCSQHSNRSDSIIQFQTNEDENEQSNKSASVIKTLMSSNEAGDDKQVLATNKHININLSMGDSKPGMSFNGSAPRKGPRELEGKKASLKEPKQFSSTESKKHRELSPIASDCLLNSVSGTDESELGEFECTDDSNLGQRTELVDDEEAGRNSLQKKRLEALTMERAEREKKRQRVQTEQNKTFLTDEIFKKLNLADKVPPHFRTYDETLNPQKLRERLSRQSYESCRNRRLSIRQAHYEDFLQHRSLTRPKQDATAPFTRSDIISRKGSSERIIHKPFSGGFQRPSLQSSIPEGCQSVASRWSKCEEQRDLILFQDRILKRRQLESQDNGEIACYGFMMPKNDERPPSEPVDIVRKSKSPFCISEKDFRSPNSAKNTCQPKPVLNSFDASAGISPIDGPIKVDIAPPGAQC